MPPLQFNFSQLPFASAQGPLAAGDIVPVMKNGITSQSNVGAVSAGVDVVDVRNYGTLGTSDDSAVMQAAIYDAFCSQPGNLTASLGPAQFTASQAGTVLTITVPLPFPITGRPWVSAVGMPARTFIDSYGTCDGSVGSTGTVNLNQAVTTEAAQAVTYQGLGAVPVSSSLATVTAPLTFPIGVGTIFQGTGIPAAPPTFIKSLGTCNGTIGSTGTLLLNQPCTTEAAETIAAIIPNGGPNAFLNRELLFPHGRFQIKSPLYFPRVQGARIRGRGRFATQITNTTVGGSVFVTNGFQYNVVGGFALACTSGVNILPYPNSFPPVFYLGFGWHVVGLTLSKYQEPITLGGVPTSTLIKNIGSLIATSYSIYETPLVATPSTTCGFSLRAKKNVSNFLFITFGGSGNNNFVTVIFDLNAGVVGEHVVGSSGGSFVSASITPTGNDGYFLCQFIGASGANNGGYFEFGLAHVATGGTYASSGEPIFTSSDNDHSIFVDGACMTIGSALTDFGTVDQSTCCFDLDYDGNPAPGTSLQSCTVGDMFFDGGDYCVEIGRSTFQGSEMLFPDNFYIRANLAGLAVKNFNALQETFEGGNFQACAAGLLDIAGSFPIVQGVGFQQQIDYDIEILNSGHDAYEISGCRTESANFLYSPSSAKGSLAGNSMPSAVSYPGVFASGGSWLMDANSSDYGVVTGGAVPFIRSSNFFAPNWMQGTRPPVEPYSAVATASPVTLTGAQMVGLPGSSVGQSPSTPVVVDLTATLGAPGTFTTDTAENIWNALNNFFPIDTTFNARTLRVRNLSPANFPWTGAGGTGVTPQGTMTIPQNTYRDFMLTMTADGPSFAYNLRSMGSGSV